MKTQKQNKSISFKGKDFFIGIDVHKKHWTVTIRHNGLALKTFSTNPDPKALFLYLNKHYPQAHFHIVYEIGHCGFWIYRKFKELELDCIVVNPSDIPSAHKEKNRKTDYSDSHKLARELENQNLKPIFVPPIHL